MLKLAEMLNQCQSLSAPALNLCLLQHHSSKASILRHSAFFMVQLSHPYMTTGKNHSFDYTGLCQKVMSLLFNMLSSFVIVFLPRSKCLLISWLQSLSTVILEPKKIKSVTVSGGSPSICHEAMGPGRRRWHPTPVLLPGESHGWRSLAGYTP